MNMFEIAITTAVAHHTEQKPFETRAEAAAYAAREAASVSAIFHDVTDLGEARLVKVEVTDTYGGEANYSWVKNFEEWVLWKSLNRVKKVKIAKRLAGWTGDACDTVDFGDTIQVKPRKLLQIMFITLD